MHLRIDDAEHQLQVRSEEHTSELQSQSNLVCRLLLEKKKIINFGLLKSTTCSYIASEPILDAIPDRVEHSPTLACCYNSRHRPTLNYFLLVSPYSFL